MSKRLLIAGESSSSERNGRLEPRICGSFFTISGKFSFRNFQVWHDAQKFTRLKKRHIWESTPGANKTINRKTL